MKARFTVLCTLTLLFAAAGPLHADTIKLKNGTRIKGEATAYDETTRLVSIRTDAGQDRQIPLDDLDGRSFYQVVRSKVPKDSGSKQLRLANYARDVGLYAHAVRHYDYAAKADSALREQVDQEMAVLRRLAGDWAMGLAREAIAKGDAKTAEKWLKKIVLKLPDEPVAREAAAMLDRYHTEVHAAKDDALEAKHAALLEKDLKNAKKYYDRMIEKNKSALTNSGSGNKAVKEWESALKDGERAGSELDKFAKKHDDAGMSEAISGYRKLLDEQLIEVHLNLASHWVTRSSHNKALSEANKAIAIDPTNAAARSMRARIEDASNRGWGWGGRQ